MASQDIEISAKESLCESEELSSDTESQLLASDLEDNNTVEECNVVEKNDTCNDEFYIDNKPDRGNLYVSTIYYPARPKYHYNKSGYVLGGKNDCKEKTPKQRYFQCPISEEPDASEFTKRVEAYRRLIVEYPEDVTIWLKFINFQECCGTLEGLVSVAEEAVARLPYVTVLLNRLLAALQVTLPPHRFLERMHYMIATEKFPNERLVLWEWLLRSLPMETSTDADLITSAATAALNDTRAAHGAYPRLLYAAGLYLREAGLWERLILLIEIVVGMNYPASDTFPPKIDPEEANSSEQRLMEEEEKITRSGLPLSAVWVRVERARAAAHWRAAPGPSADPERPPLPHAVADLLHPLVLEEDHVLLSIRLLMLAKVPLLPGTDWAASCFGAPAADCAECLLPLLLEARDLPIVRPAHASVDAARRLLMFTLDPPHYFTDDAGYLSWVESLWETLCSAATGAAHVALLCWRLRWWRSLLLLTLEDEGGLAERERVLRRARSALRRRHCSDTLPFAEFALLQYVTSGSDRAAHVAKPALRAALTSATVPRTHALYAARVLAKVSANADEGMCAIVCAALGRVPPPNFDAPSSDDIAAALQMCEERCEELEREYSIGGCDTGLTAAAALLPGPGEWARARAVLSSPIRRRHLLQTLPTAARSARSSNSTAASRYYEESAVALVAATACDGRFAHATLTLIFPYSAYLACVSAGAPMWVSWQLEKDDRITALTDRSDFSALAKTLPALLRVMSDDTPFTSESKAEEAVRALRRATRSSARKRGALLWILRLETEARALKPQLPVALYTAINDVPAAKWVYLRGTVWCSQEATALEEALIERRLRLHTIRDELHAAAEAVNA